MSYAQAGNEPGKRWTLADYVTILQRRKWILIVVPLVTGLIAFAYAERRTPSYRAEALVLLNQTNVVSGVTGTQDPAAFDSPRFMSTQANIARSPKLAARVAATAGVPGLTPGQVLADSDVEPDTTSDLLEFSVSSPNPRYAISIANKYATSFTSFKSQLDTLRVNNALGEIRSRMRALETSGQSNGTAYQTLTEYQSQLLISRDLLTNSASVLRPAGTASEIGTSPARMFVAGVLLGLLLALGIVALLEALDRRVRSEEELGETLELPLLGRVARPPSRLEVDDHPVMLAEPSSVYSETFRRLRTNIEFVNRTHKARTIMFTSAAPREGKSTTVANVAIAFARAGQRVALVDLDVRLPTQHSLFAVRSSPGIAEIVAGDYGVDKAMQRIALPTAGTSPETPDNGRPVVSSNSRWNPVGESVASTLGDPTNGHSDTQYFLHLLVGGRIPSADLEFLSNERVAAVLDELADEFDVVFVDSPPLLAVGDAMALSAKVDAIVVVTEFGIKRPLLKELARELENCQAPRIGFIVTGVSEEEGYGYGYGAESARAATSTRRTRQRVGVASRAERQPR